MRRLFLLFCIGTAIFSCLASEDELEVRTVTQEQFDEAVKRSLESLEQKKLLHTTASASRKKSTGYHRSQAKIPSENADKRFLIQETANNLAKIVGVTEAVEFRISEEQLEKSQLRQTCPKITCRPNRFRTSDGTCNIIHRPRFGSAHQKLRRTTPANFTNGSGFRTSFLSSKIPLPSARLVSIRTISDKSVLSNDHTLLVMQWGQFMDHDLSITENFEEVAVNSGRELHCCAANGQFPAKITDARCAPFRIFPGDVFSPRTCHEFARSVPAPASTCSRMIPDLPKSSNLNKRATVRPREFLNEVTAWIDGSMIYGSSLKTQLSLRTRKGGEMKVKFTNTENLLPLNARGQFSAGDVRVNEQPDLTMIHTVFVRLHNRIAKQISALQPKCSDEDVFQRARKLVAALVQHVTYSEFLPILLGEYTTNIWLLDPMKRGYLPYRWYSNPQLSIEFTTAAFRVGHTMVPSRLPMVDENAKRVGSELLRESFGEGIHLFENEKKIDLFARASCKEAMESVDCAVSEELTNHLFENENEERIGMDLVARNVQRGRDHGLQSYVQTLRSFRFLHWRYRFYSFHQFYYLLGRTNMLALMSVYRHPEDVDLFIAGLMEKPYRGGLVGRTFNRIIAEQFRLLKLSDQKFYERSSEFTLPQLDNIRRLRLSSIMCQTMDLESTPVNVFERKSPDLPCNELPFLNIQLFHPPSTTTCT